MHNKAQDTMHSQLEIMEAENREEGTLSQAAEKGQAATDKYGRL